MSQLRGVAGSSSHCIYRYWKCAHLGSLCVLEKGGSYTPKMLDFVSLLSLFTMIFFSYPSNFSVGVPNFWTYQGTYSSSTCYLYIALRINNESLWKSLMAGHNLAHAPWFNQQHRGLSRYASTITLKIFKSWDIFSSKYCLTKAQSPSASPGEILWFGPGEDREFIGIWVADGDICCVIYAVNLQTMVNIWDNGNHSQWIPRGTCKLHISLTVWNTLLEI